MSQPDLKIIKHAQKHMPKANPRIANGFSYEEMKGAVAWVDSVMRSAFETLGPIGFSYKGYTIPGIYEGMEALSRSQRSKRALEVTETSSYPITCLIEFKDQQTGQVKVFRKNTHITFMGKGNVFSLNGSKYIGSPKLGDKVLSLDKDNIFVGISRSRMVFIRTPYYFVKDNKIVSTDIHRTKLYYESSARKKQAKANPSGIPTLVNYMLCEHGLTGAFKKFYNVDVEYMREEDYEKNQENYPRDEFVVCRAKGLLKARNIKRSNIVLIFKRKQYTKNLDHIVAAVFFILDNRLECPGLMIDQLDSTTGWTRALARWALEETDEFAACEKAESHVNSVKSYIDHATKMKFNREGYPINDIYDLFKYIIHNFSIIASTHNVASMENKVLSILPHFLFNLTSSIFKMMYDLQKQAAKRPLSCQQVQKLLMALWKEEAALSRLTSADNVRNLDHATDCMLLKATRLIVPQAKRGPGSKKMAEMNDPAFAAHWSKVGMLSYQFVNKSCPTAMDSLNPMCELGPNNEVRPHKDAVKIIENVRELTEIRKTI